MDDGHNPSYIEAVDSALSGQPENPRLARRILPSTELSLGTVSTEGAMIDGEERLPNDNSETIVALEEIPVDHFFPASDSEDKPGDVAFINPSTTERDDTLSEEENEATVLSGQDLELVRFFLDNPQQALGNLRIHLSAAYDWTMDDFREARGRLTSKLSEMGVTVQWRKTGSGIGSHYTLEVIEGNDSFRRTLRVVKDEPEVAADIKEPQEVYVPSAREVLEDPDLHTKIVDIIENGRGRTHVRWLVQSLFKTGNINRQEFEDLKAELKIIVASGAIRYVGKGVYVVPKSKIKGEKGRGNLKLAHTDGKPKQTRKKLPPTPQDRS